MSFVISAWNIIQSVHNEGCICEDKVIDLRFLYFHLIYHCPLYDGTCPFVGGMIFYFPFIMYIGWMVHVYTIKFHIYIMLGAPPLILSISSNIIPEFLDVSGFNVGNYLDISLVGFPSFSVSVGLVYFYFSLGCCKDSLFSFLTYIDELLVKEFWHSWGMYLSIIFMIPCCCNSQ